jgi:hypothetical protein
MNKKIKVIELFDIIAKGIDIPARVEYRQKIYKFDSDIMDYVSQDEELCLSLLIVGYDDFKESLNGEVEILEDEDEDEEEIDIQELEDVNLFDNGQNFNDMPIIIKSYDDNFTNINNAINDLIKAVRKLDRKINKEG